MCTLVSEGVGREQLWDAESQQLPAELSRSFVEAKAPILQTLMHLFNFTCDMVSFTCV